MITTDIKKRFCKDEKISIQLFQSPFFEERIKLLDKEESWKKFQQLYENTYNSDEQTYFTEYGKLKDSIIDYIKDSTAFKKLNSCDIREFSDKISKYTFRQDNVYKDKNIGKVFISIDIVKANFTSFVHYGLNRVDTGHDGSAFFKNYNWTEFMHTFTDIDHFIDSKYIRQVVFGNCDCKRQMIYQKYLVTCKLEELFNIFKLDEQSIYSLCNDEIVLDASKLTTEQTVSLFEYFNKLNASNNFNDISYKISMFKIGRIFGSSVYLKYDLQLGEEDTNIDIHNINRITIKCMDAIDAVFIHRLLKGETITDNDHYFSFNGKLSKFMETPQYTITFEPKEEENNSEE